QADAPILSELRQLAAAGLGEVELHYHHNSDTAESLRAGLHAAIDQFQQFGFLKSIDGSTHFAFVHGNGSLDNSDGSAMCGVNDELRVLRALGCFGDFTFPNIFTSAQPPFVNTIYAARDDDRPKSYRVGWPLSALD